MTGLKYISGRMAALERKAHEHDRVLDDMTESLQNIWQSVEALRRRVKNREVSRR